MTAFFKGGPDLVKCVSYHLDLEVTWFWLPHIVWFHWLSQDMNGDELQDSLEEEYSWMKVIGRGDEAVFRSTITVITLLDWEQRSNSKYWAKQTIGFWSVPSSRTCTHYTAALLIEYHNAWKQIRLHHRSCRVEMYSLKLSKLQKSLRLRKSAPVKLAHDDK